MSNSPLISGTLLTNNCSAPRNHAIDTITPHYMAAYASARACCESFVPAARRASANYCIGKDGEIWLNVSESNRAWTSGSSTNDNRAVTIECANFESGKLPDATWTSLVLLCADICKRNGKNRLVYVGSVNYNTLKSNEMLLTKHKWFQSTDCPGPWLDTRFSALASEVNKLLDGGVSPTPIEPSFGGMYVCKVSCLNVRTKPTVNSEVVAEYHKNDIVILEDWQTSCDGYIWGRYVAEKSGLTRYVAVGRDTGKVEDDDYLVKV